MPWLVLALCLLGTLIVWDQARVEARTKALENFHARAERIHRDIERRMLAYDQVLKGAAGLFAASETVQRAEWRAYVLGLGIEGHYPGIHGLGYIEYVAYPARESFLARVRQDGGDDNAPGSFNITPPGTRPDYFVVKFIEPIERNRPALGLDVGAESTRRQAAEAARDRGDAVVTRRVRLAQSTQDTPGVLLLRPIYRNGQPTADPAQRRAALEGWVYGAFQVNELMEKVLGDDQPDMDFEIYDDEDGRMNLGTLLYDHDRVLQAGQPPPEGVFTHNSSLHFAHHTWTLHFRTRPAFAAGEVWNKPRFVAIAGVCMSLLLFSLTLALASTQARAQGLARDITRTLQVQERAMSSSSTSIMILDAARPGLSIIYANPAVERMTGYTASELTGRDGSILLGPEREQPGVGALRAAIAQRCEGRAVLHCFRKDGTAFWNEIRLSPVITRSGVVTHFISVSTEITARVESEQHLQAARAAAEAANRAKSEFLANISHEIRTPLNAILGMTELVLDTPLTDEQHRHLTAARQSAHELATLVNDVLDFSRIEAGKLELQPEPFGLRPLLDRCLAASAARAREKGLTLSLKIDPDVPDTLHADVMRLRQVLVNLIGNAVKFTNRGGITLEVRLAATAGRAAEPRSARESPAAGPKQTLLPLAPPPAPSPAPAAEPASGIILEFLVADTGIGIHPDKQETIFQPFTQADNSITRHYGGTGLGLAISRRLVTLLGGTIWVESEEGRGSRFHFTAPCGRAAEADLPAAEAEAAPIARARRHLRVLVVEDNPVNALLATAFLERLGHSVIQAADGHEAVASAARGESDLILMDLQMPGLDGLQATARIRAGERERGGHVPIIALTAHALASDRAQCLAAGMDDYLSKPVRRAALFAAIEKLLPGAAPPPAALPPTDTSPLRLRLLTQLGGDAAAVQRLIALFLETTPALLAELAAAAAARSPEGLARAAHTLKGSLMQMGDANAQSAARLVENTARAGQLDDALAALPALERETARVNEELRRLLPTAP